MFFFSTKGNHQENKLWLALTTSTTGIHDKFFSSVCLGYDHNVGRTKTLINTRYKCKDLRSDVLIQKTYPDMDSLLIPG